MRGRRDAERRAGLDRGTPRAFRVNSVSLPDANDRYVLAAARHCEAHYILTANLRDFPAAALAPFRLVAERHYLVAWSENEQACDFRHFALSNIERVEILDRVFTRPRNFSLKDYPERSLGVFQEEPFDVVWKFSAAVAADAREFFFIPIRSWRTNTMGPL